MKYPLYQKLAELVLAIDNCEKSGNSEWRVKHNEYLQKLIKQYLPSGSGFDAGTGLDICESNPQRLVFTTAFHHMNDAGYYVGWTEHKVIITPSLAFGFDIRITGRDKNDIKNYINECFYSALRTEVEA
jgi:hypothetical protein